MEIVTWSWVDTTNQRRYDRLNQAIWAFRDHFGCLPTDIWAHPSLFTRRRRSSSIRLHRDHSLPHRVVEMWASGMIEGYQLMAPRLLVIRLLERCQRYGGLMLVPGIIWPLQKALTHQDGDPLVVTVTSPGLMHLLEDIFRHSEATMTGSPDLVVYRDMALVMGGRS